MLVLDQRYYLNKDKSRAMSESDMADEQKRHAALTSEQLANLSEEDRPFEPEFLLGGKGSLISEGDAERLGISDLDGRELHAEKAVANAIKGLPNYAAVEVQQLLPPEEDRTALQRVQDVMFRQDEKNREDNPAGKHAEVPAGLRRSSRRERAQTGEGAAEGSGEAT